MESKFQTFKHFRGSLAENMISSGDTIAISVQQSIIQPKKLPEEAVAMLTQRLGDEYNAHYTYRNAANWCKNMNYKKAAAYFESEAASELDHAKMLQDYLTQWNVMPCMPTVSASKNFSGLVHIIDEAYDIEYNLLLGYSENQKELCHLHPASHNFIQEMVDIQNQSVGEYSDLLNALCLIDINNKLDLLYFEQTYF